jgi:hypothetical protein
MGEKRKLTKDIDAAEFMTWVQVMYESVSGADAHAASSITSPAHQLLLLLAKNSSSFRKPCSVTIPLSWTSHSTAALRKV